MDQILFDSCMGCASCTAIRTFIKLCDECSCHFYDFILDVLLISLTESIEILSDQVPVHIARVCLLGVADLEQLTYALSHEYCSGRSPIPR